MGKNGGGRNRRRPHGSRSRNPRRGPPAMLLTCLTGREPKCRAEGMDLLRHYYYHKAGRGKEGEEDNREGGGDGGKSGLDQSGDGEAELSLEQEVELLRKGASADEVLLGPSGKRKAGQSGAGNKGRRRGAFSVYEPGCRVAGTVIVMCSLPNCELVPVGGRDRRGAEGSAHDGPSHKSKRARLEDDNDDSDDSDDNDEGVVDPPWDPVQVFRQISSDVVLSSRREGDGTAASGPGGPASPPQTSRPSAAARDAPSSRFVTRMIPLQATCFPSLEDMSRTCRLLLEKYLTPLVSSHWEGQHTKAIPNGTAERNGEEMGKRERKPSTFEINFKRRNCANVRREAVIQALGQLISEMVEPGSLAVDLGGNADFTIQIEVLNNLCGMSVIDNRKMPVGRFNLIEMRQSGQEDDSDGKP